MTFAATDRKMTNGLNNGWSDEHYGSSGMTNGRSSRLGSDISLSAMDPAGGQTMAMAMGGVPPTPTYSLPPTTPLWEHPVYQPASVPESVPVDFMSVKSGSSWPEPKVGGRIKRFTDVETQTETVGVATESKPIMVDAEMQTDFETSRPESSEPLFPAPASSPPDSLGSRENGGNSLFSLNLGMGCSMDGPLAGDIGGRGEGSFDPLFDSMNLMSIGGLKLSLGE